MSSSTSINNIAQRIGRLDQLIDKYYLWGPIKNGSRVYVVTIDTQYIAYFARLVSNGSEPRIILDPLFNVNGPDIYIMESPSENRTITFREENNRYSIGTNSIDNSLIISPIFDGNPEVLTRIDPQNTQIVNTVENVDFQNNSGNIDGEIARGIAMSGVPYYFTQNSRFIRWFRYSANPGNYKIGDGLDTNCFPINLNLNENGLPQMEMTNTVHIVPVDWYNSSNSCQKVAPLDAYKLEQQWAISRYLIFNGQTDDNPCSLFGANGYTYDLICRGGKKISYCHSQKSECGICLGGCTDQNQICLVDSESNFTCQTVKSQVQTTSIWEEPWIWVAIILGSIFVLISIILIGGGIYNMTNRAKSN